MFASIPSLGLLPTTMHRVTTRENDEAPSSPPFARLSRRRKGLGPEDPIDGVPDYLDGILRSWFIGWLQAMPVSPRSLGLRLHLAWEMPYVPIEVRQIKNYMAEAAAVVLWATASKGGGDVVLDLVDLALRDAYPPEANLAPSHGVLIGTLDAILLEAGSIWRPTADGDALEERVSGNVRELLATVTSATGQGAAAAEAHLQEAWRRTYGRHPDPSKAYAEAIRAVESAAIPVVTPNDNQATLGTIRGQLRSQSKEFKFPIAPTAIAPVAETISALWEGQTDRHGRPDGVHPISKESAEAAVALAIILVHWFTTGAVQRR